ncbi:MAG: Fe-S protein assembly co-chaperone HscB [Ignavibacteriota bacterium]
MQQNLAAAEARLESDRQDMQDFFLTLGTGRTFGFDNAALERRFHELQRSSHPDRFSGRESAIIDSALERSSDINEAYRTLRDPLKRTKHLLSLFGYSVEQTKQVPMDLLELVMNVQEKVAELEFASEDARADIISDIDPILNDLEEKKTAIDDEADRLRNRWDGMHSHTEPRKEISDNEKNILQQLAAKLASRAYITTLLYSLKAAAKGESLVVKH